MQVYIACIQYVTDLESKFLHIEMLLLSRSNVSNSVRPHRWQPTRLPHPWDSPGKNTGVGCHFLLHCMKVKSESEVAQLCPTPRDPMDCSPSDSSVHGIFQARVLEWGAIAFSNYICTSNLIMLSSCLQTSVTSQFSLKKKMTKILPYL